MRTRTLRRIPAPDGAALEPHPAGPIDVDPAGVGDPQGIEGTEAVMLIANGMAPAMPDNPLARTIWPGPRRGLILSIIRRMRHLWEIREPLLLALINAPIKITSQLWHARPWRARTGEEIEMQKERDRRAKLHTLLMSEAMLYWDRLENALDRNQFRHISTKQEGGVKTIKHVGFNDIRLSPEAIWLRIDTGHLPYGTRISDLMDKELLADLSVSCQHRVSAEWSEQIGAWYIVERAIGVRGIPDHVKFADLLAGMPASADGLTVPIGISVNAKRIYASLGRMYSMLVAGTIGGGKSNILNVILVALIRRNTPSQLNLILVDLKGGLEFQFYEGLPHLIKIPEFAPTGICDNNEQVPGVLKWLHGEGERRMGILREAGYKSIGRYNAYQRKRRLPHILLVIDEWADVMYNKEIKNQCEETLANVAQRFRAVGIHVIVCTQIPKAEVISTRIKGVLPAKLAFSVPSQPASMVVLDNARAKSLQPAGRCIFQWNDELEVQSPYINEEIIEAAIKQAISGKVDAVAAGHDVTQLEVLEWALANENGYLSRDRLFVIFGKRGVKVEELNGWLADWEGKQFVIGTSLYRVDPATGSRPRRLIAIDEDADDIPDDQQE